MSISLFYIFITNKYGGGGTQQYWLSLSNQKNIWLSVDAYYKTLANIYLLDFKSGPQCSLDCINNQQVHVTILFTGIYWLAAN